MDTRELLKKVRLVELRTRGLVDQVFSGEYHSVFKGRGMNFSEVREYQFGDDIRSIDWNVSARFNHPYLKVYEEERELTVMLIVDVSGSGYFGASRRFKNEAATEVCALLALSPIKQHDKAGRLHLHRAVSSAASRLDVHPLPPGSPAPFAEGALAFVAAAAVERVADAPLPALRLGAGPDRVVVGLPGKRAAALFRTEADTFSAIEES